MRNFKIGDRVRAYGLHGQVIWISADLDYPVEVNLDGVGLETFTLDGKVHLSHKEPTLELIAPAKPIKKTLYIAIQSSPDYGSTRGAHQCSFAYPNRADVDDMFTKPFQIIETIIESEEE